MTTRTSPQVAGAARRIVGALTAHLRRWRWFYASIVIGLIAKETFPFSNWPMYATFGPRANYVYVTDTTGAPIPHLSVLGESSARLKKRFRSEAALAAVQMNASGTPISTREARHRAGLQVLNELAPRLSAAQRRQLGGLRLVYVGITDNHRALVHTDTVVAEIVLREPVTTRPPPRSP